MIQNVKITSWMINRRHFSFRLLGPVSPCLCVPRIGRIKNFIMIFEYCVDLFIDPWINYICFLMLTSFIDQVLNFDINVLELDFI